MSKSNTRPSLLDMVERVGNRLPEPPVLFMLLAALVVALSALGSVANWSVQPVQPRAATVAGVDAAGNAMQVPRTDADGRPVIELVPVGQPVTPRSLADTDGVYWMLSSMLRNFTALPALGLIFVAMLGIGLAERFGFFSALMRWLAFRTPRGLLSPVIVFLGANASVASDAGYVILPPLAAALFLAMGRSPIAGMAAAFAGVAGGFGAGFFPTGGDGALAGFAQDAAHIIDPAYTVTILHNLYFKAGSVIVVTLAGWWVTDRIVEPRLGRISGGVTGDAATPAGAEPLAPREQRALTAAVITNALVLAVFAVLVLVPGMPLHGDGQPTLADGRVVTHQPVRIDPPGTEATVPDHDVLAREPLLVTETPSRARLVESPAARWSHVIVPLIFLAFVLPGIVYGRMTGVLRSQKDLIEGFYHGIRGIVPVLAIAFFMGQFVNYLAYTRLDRMMAFSGGSLLAQASLPTELLLVLFVALVVAGDFAISGMLSKFGVLAPIFIPMFMMVGLSPELTTAAYRIGDSVVNVVTPLNSYLLVILAVFQRYRAGAGLGSLMSLMLPYSAVFAMVWTVFLLAWYFTGLPLGPSASLHYAPAP